MEHICAVCGGSNPRHSLPLTKKDGKWVVTPVCDKCKAGLMSEAFHADRSIRFFSLAESLREVEQRNSNILRYRPFLDAFSKARTSAKTVRDNGDKRKILAKAKS